MRPLALPLKHIFVTQPFGKNFLNFYRNMGMIGHNGVDFRAFDGFSCYASHTGLVISAGEDGDGGIGIEIWDESKTFKTIYYHLKDVFVKKGDSVIIGQKIGHCDNTGKYTTGSHLHFGMKATDISGNTLNKDNGYNGAIDPTPHFEMAYNGVRIDNKDCYESPAYHRYHIGPRPKGGFWIEKFRVTPALAKYLGRIPKNEEINAATYGSWDRESIANPAMRELWSNVKKGEFLNGVKPFQN